MSTWRVINDYDKELYFDVVGDSYEEAAYHALTELGYGVVKLDEDEDLVDIDEEQ